MASREIFPFVPMLSEDYLFLMYLGLRHRKIATVSRYCIEVWRRPGVDTFDICRYMDLTPEEMAAPKRDYTVEKPTTRTAELLRNQFITRVSDPHEAARHISEISTPYVIISMVQRWDSGGHQCSVLCDKKRKEFIYFNPMNTGMIVTNPEEVVQEMEAPTGVAARLYSILKEAVQTAQFEYARRTYEELQTRIRYENEGVQKMFQTHFLSLPEFKDYKIVSTLQTMVECQTFLESSRRAVQAAGNITNPGYCMPMSFYIFDAILTFRDAIDRYIRVNGLPGPVSLDHFVKRFICFPRVDRDAVRSVQYISYLGQGPDTKPSRLMTDFFTSDGIFAYYENLLKDFDQHCVGSINPWAFFMDFCKGVLVDFRNERCDAKYGEGSTYSFFKRNEGFYGWATVKGSLLWQLYALIQIPYIQSNRSVERHETYRDLYTSLLAVPQQAVRRY